MDDTFGVEKINLDKVDWRGSREFFESLGETLDRLDDKDESYDFTWVGKRKAVIEAGSPINKTFRPDIKNSKNWDTTENLFIEGDNLDALKLLQESYLSKVKMIYIDPPYNTGKDFVYHDNFKATVEQYDDNTEYKDEYGNIQFKKNDKSNGRYHSDWLSMMYPRLKLARNLLTEDGVIFISIDDNEQANLKKLCDEVFGEDNYINTVSIQMKLGAGASGGGEDKRLKKNIEYLLIYARSMDCLPILNTVYKKTEITELIDQYKNEGVSWKYTSVIVDRGEKNHIGSTLDGEGNKINIFKRENAVFKSISQIATDEGLSKQEVYKKYFNDIFVTAMPQSSIRPRVLSYIGQSNLDKSSVYSIEYVPRSGRNKGKVYEQFYKGDKLRLFAWFADVATNDNYGVYKKDIEGTYWDGINLNNLAKEGNVPFENGKKPIDLLSRILKMYPDKTITVVDFFSGSATTAHAVMQLNAEDGGNRKWIMVQLPEQTDEKSEAFKAGYKTIPEIARERIRRAGDKIATEHPDAKVDYGFRALRIDDTNYKEVYKSAGEFEQSTLLDSIDNIKDDRSDLDLLYGVLTQLALQLNCPLETRDIANAKVYLYDYFGEVSGLIACFAENISEDAIMQIAKLRPLTAVFRESSFADSQSKVNLAEHFRILSPDTKVKVI